MIKLSDDINIKSGKDDDNTEVWKKKKERKRGRALEWPFNFLFSSMKNSWTTLGINNPEESALLDGDGKY